LKGSVKPHLQNWLTGWFKRPAEMADAAWATLDDAEFLDAVYQKYLGRATDASGKHFYLQRLQQPHGRSQVLRALQTSEEARAFVERQQRMALIAEMEAQEQHPFMPRIRDDIAPQKPRVALLGTCLSESLLQTALAAAWPVQHYLMDSGPHHPVPALPATEFDAVLVQFTLRSLLGLVAEEGNGDLFHLCSDTDWAAMQERARAQLDAMLQQVLSGIPEALPVFFLAFLEPPPQINGILGRNRRDTLYALVRNLNDDLEERLSGMGRAHYLELNDLRQYVGDATAYDGYASHFSHGGLLNSWQGDRIHLGIFERLQAALQVLRGENPVKLIITDLDNTLWRGVLAEEEEIIPLEATEGWPLGYVEALLACKRRGILLAICSKNEEATTRQNFQNVWGNRLRLDDFCSVQINWQPKSANIARILEETNLLPEHVLFIDDHPLEIAEVTRAYPQIRTLSGAPERWRHVLLYAPETQVAQISTESAQRTELIQAKKARDTEAATMDRSDYLRSLELTLHFDRITDAQHPRYARALELLNKTNQFNTTGQRWSDAEMQACLGAGGMLLSATATDRFAAHGLIALALVQEGHIAQVVLSCRVFGLGIETALLHQAMSLLREQGHAHITGRLLPTGRNAACQSFYSDNGFVAGESDGLWVGLNPPGWPEWIAVGVS
jgi:FkbH-like protein